MSPQRSVIIADTNATDVSGAFAFTVIAAAVISALSGGTNLTGFAGVSLPAGITLFIPGTTSITLASGTIAVYKM